MEKEDIIFVAESCGLSYQGDNEDGEPEFLGTEKLWDLFKSKDIESVVKNAKEIAESDNYDLNNLK